MRTVTYFVPNNPLNMPGVYMPISCASSWRGQHSEKEQMEKARVCSSSRGVSREVRISCPAAHGGPLPTLWYNPIRSPQRLLSGTWNSELNASYKHSHLDVWEERTEEVWNKDFTNLKLLLRNKKLWGGGGEDISHPYHGITLCKLNILCSLYHQA